MGASLLLKGGGRGGGVRAMHGCGRGGTRGEVHANEVLACEAEEILIRFILKLLQELVWRFEVKHKLRLLLRKTLQRVVNVCDGAQTIDAVQLTWRGAADVEERRKRDTCVGGGEGGGGAFASSRG